MFETCLERYISFLRCVCTLKGIIIYLRTKSALNSYKTLLLQWYYLWYSSAVNCKNFEKFCFKRALLFAQDVV